MDNNIKKLKGGNLDIDLDSIKSDIDWEQDDCPWNLEEKTGIHKCAIKNESICEYFCGVEYVDKVLCCYPNKNPLKDN